MPDLELKMYKDEESGTFHLLVEDIERKIDAAKNTTLEARAALELARIDRVGMRELFRLGYQGKSAFGSEPVEFPQGRSSIGVPQ